MTTLSTLTELTDADLVSRSLAGDREAFSQIVLRYQTLVCSLAYSVIGNLGQSEDAAQETFIVAWKRLRHLREPSKLRAWLCGIVHNRARDSIRRDGREAAAGAQSLDVIQEIAASEALPSETAIGNEEQAIMWRALCRVPEIYRQPLILFYREQNSVERVAEALELSEDAVKQRLSRGRKLLHQEVIAFVEDALRQTAPKRSFTASVLSALPLAPGLAASGGLTAAGKGAAAKSAGIVAVVSGSLLSIAGVLLGLGAQLLVLRASPSAREKRIKAMWFAGIWGITLVAWGIQPALGILGRRFGWDDQTLTLAQAANWWLYTVILMTMAIVMFRSFFAMRRQAYTESNAPAPRPVGGWKSATVLLGGVYGANMFWLVAVAWRANDPITAWVIGITTALLAGWHLRRLEGKDCNQGLRLAAEHLTMVWGLVILTLNLRLDHWLAALRGVELSQWHQIFPAWVIPALTVALLAWLGAVVAMTRPQLSKAGIP